MNKSLIRFYNCLVPLQKNIYFYRLNHTTVLPVIIKRCCSCLKISAFFFVFTGLTLHSYSQTVFLQWAHSYGSTIADNAAAIGTDASGNVYVSGQFGGSIDFDPGTGVFVMTSTSGGYDLYLSKFDPNGNFLWARQSQGPGAGAFSLALDNSGNVYLSGIGDGYSFISKVDPNGNLVWTAQFPFSVDRTKVGIDNSGNVYATGKFSGTVDFDPGPGMFNLTSADGATFVLKLNTNGNFVWAFQIDNLGINSNPGKSIVVNQSGDFYISGAANQAADYDPSAGVYMLPANGACIFVAKYNANGNLIWAQSIGGGGSINNYSTALDPSGNIFLTGSFVGSIDFDPGPGVFNLSTGANSNTYVLKLDNNGHFSWVRMVEGPLQNWAYAIACDNSGSIYITGFFGGSTDFDPGPGLFNINTVGLASYDVFIWKIDNAGNFLTVVPLGSVNYDLGQAIAVDASRNIYCSGSFGGTMDCDPGAGVYNLNMVDFGDAFFLKFSQCANVSYTALNETACSSYTFNNQTYTSTGTYTQVLQNLSGCDSIITLHLIISGSTDTINVIACNNYFWNGQTYTSSGFYRDTLVNSIGCDSIINLNLTINYSATVTISATICEGDNYIGYTSTGIYIDTFVAVNGCDSVRTLNLIVKPKSYSNLNAAICGGGSYLGYTSTGVYIDTLVAANGCDSIRTLNLVVHPTYATDVNMVICEGQFYLAGGTNQTVTGVYRDTLQTYFGCDSIIVTHLTVNPKPRPDLGVDKNLCAGQALTLNPGSFANYKWHNQSTMPYFIANAVGYYWVEVTDNNNCKASDTMQITNILSPPTNFLKPFDSVCQYDKLLIKPLTPFLEYTWSTGSTQASIMVDHPGVFTLEVKDANYCVGKDSIEVFQKICHTGVYVPTGFSPNADQLNDVFKARVYGIADSFELEVFDRWGNLVFRTTDPEKGWDGKIKGTDAMTGVFVWQCSYHLKGERQAFQKGILTLIR